MRLFLAIAVPRSVQERIKKIQSKLAGARLVRPDQCHITLKFLGEVTDVQSLKKKLSHINFPQFSLLVDKIEGFPNKTQPKVIYLSDSETTELSALARKIDSMTGEFKRDKPFTYHITIARVQRPVVFDLDKIKIERTHFSAREFILYRSVLEAEGPEYTVLARFPLRQNKGVFKSLRTDTTPWLTVLLPVRLPR